MANLFRISFTAAMDSYFRGVKYVGGFDLVLAHKTSAANPAANPATSVYLVLVLFSDLCPKYLYKNVPFLHLYFGLRIWV